MYIKVFIYGEYCYIAKYAIQYENEMESLAIKKSRKAAKKAQ